MDSIFCSSQDSTYICSIHTASWSIPLLCLIVLILSRLKTTKIQLHRNRNVNFSAISQYFLISIIPLIEILTLIINYDHEIPISRFLTHLISFVNYCIFLGLMRTEFPRMTNPGVYTISIRLYFLMLLMLQSGQTSLTILYYYENSSIFPLIISESLKNALIFLINIFSITSVIKSRSFNLQPLLYEEAKVALSEGQQEGLEKVKNDEENDEYRLTRSTSVITSIMDLSMKGSFTETKSYNNNGNNGNNGNNCNNKKGLNIDIQKVLISHDSNSEIIVLYEIKVLDSKGKVLRTIYRRFSEFETLHNEVYFL